jgi:hypothetical protein
MVTPLFSLENLHRQYLQCRRNKRNTRNALRFEYRLAENLLRLRGGGPTERIRVVAPTAGGGDRESQAATSKLN